MRTKFVAEISSNHNGDIGRSIAMIEAAKQVGCDAVKFQLFRIDELFAPEVLKAKKAWLKAARTAKKTIPKPSFRPAIYQVA